MKDIPEDSMPAAGQAPKPATAVPTRSALHRRRRHRPVTPPGQVGFEGGEHTAIGDSAMLYFAQGDPGDVAWNVQLHLPNGAQFTYGQIVALGGDFYGVPARPISDGTTPEDRIARFVAAFETLATNPAAVAESKEILAVMKIEIDAVNAALFDGQPASTAYAKLGDSLSYKWEFITKGRYLSLAAVNWDHFSQHAVSAYQAGHAAALAQAVVAHGSPQRDQRARLELAYAMNAFADHFLSDLFSAGHVRTPRKELYEISSVHLAASALARFMHNEDSRYGLNVSNQQGVSWRAYGDDRYFDSVDNQNLTLVDQTVQLSADEVFQAFLSGQAPDPGSYQALSWIVDLGAVQDYEDFARNNAPLFIKDDAGVWPRKGINDLSDHEWPHDLWTAPTLLTRFQATYKPPYPLPGHVHPPASAPVIAGWNSAVQVPPDWLAGNSVRYAVSFLVLATGEESDLGPWSGWAALDGGYEATLASVPVDAEKIATARRVYRQFAIAGGTRTFTVPIGIIPDNSSTTFADTAQTSQVWEQLPGVPGGFAQVSVGRDGTAWGIDANGGIWRYVGGPNSWQSIAGPALAQISVGAVDAVWGVDPSGAIHRYAGMGRWTVVPGRLTDVSVGSATVVWGHGAPDGSIWRYVGAPTWWTQVPGVKEVVAVGSDGGAWSLGSGYPSRYDPASRTWVPVAGMSGFGTISVANASNIWGQTSQALYRYLGSRSKAWIQVPGTAAFYSVAVGNGGDVWALDALGRPFRYVPSGVLLPADPE
jgi:hypothetical protein